MVLHEFNAAVEEAKETMMEMRQDRHMHGKRWMEEKEREHQEGQPRRRRMYN